MKQKLNILLCFLVLTIIFNELLYAQCDKKLRPVKSVNIGYHIRSNNRC